MPELPEVETTLSGIKPHILNKTISKCIVRNRQLRWPIPEEFELELKGQSLIALERRSKYLILSLESQTHVLVHLGMSGSLCCVTPSTPLKKHDHVDIVFDNDIILRYNDPRRFGCLLLINGKPDHHKLLNRLGLEPLDKHLTPEYLKNKFAARRTLIKTALMDQSIIAGLGNIYVCEALFLSGIHPQRACHELTDAELEKLCSAIKAVIQLAISQGGTTLKDFTKPDGKPGYFKQSLHVYGREGEACLECGSPLHGIRINNRATVFCSNCQL